MQSCYRSPIAMTPPPTRNIDLVSTLLLRHVSCQLQNYRTLPLSHRIDNRRGQEFVAFYRGLSLLRQVGLSQAAR